MKISIGELDFQIAKMGIRLLVSLIIVKMCLINSRKIQAWPVVSYSRVIAGQLLPEHRIRDANPAAFSIDDRFERGKLSTQSIHTQRSDGDWSELVLTIQWPQTFCMTYNDSTPSPDGCVVPSSVNDWTIHGLWPSNPGKLGPFFCNNTWKFDVKKILDIESEMNVSWPDFIVDEPYDGLWSHEWDKHGTCAASLPALYGEHNYFQKVLTLKKKYDIFSMLQQRGIVPSATKSYSYEDVFNAVEFTIGADPIITCAYDFKTNRVYLSQVEICMDKQFNLVDCEASNSPIGQNIQDENCSHDKSLFYPVKN